MSNAPVCNIAVTSRPGAPKVPGLQPIPRATDLASALKAIQAITNNFNIITNQLGAHANFTENRNLRTVTQTRIFDPNNKAVFVDVEQITGLTFVNSATGQTITWKQGDGAGVVPGGASFGGG